MTMRGEESAAGTSGTGESGASSPPDRTTDGDLERLQAVIERAADGDLTVRAGEEIEDEGVAAVADALDDLLGRFERTVTDVDEFGDQVAGATGHVDGLVDDVKANSDEVSDAVARISEGASEQAERIDTTVEELQDLSASTEEVASSAEEVATTAESISERSREGREAANRAIDELGVIEERTDEALARVGALNDRVQEIEDVVEFIGDVAERTNILALNASIEAARAGEEGSGFAVVAEEVKSLAEEAGDATDEIDASIEEVRAEATETLEEIETMRERVDRGVETAEDALAVFAELADDIEETSEGVREISAATDDQAASVEEAVAMVEGVGDISDDTAERAARVADAADEQTTALTEVAASVSALGDRSEELRSLLDDYEAGRTAATAAGDVTTVQFWHAMGGEKGLFLEQLVEEFEAEAGDVHVETASKGSYRGVFDATLSAVEEGSPPTVAQLYEIGTKRAMDSGAFAPVEPLLADDELDVDALLDPVADYYSTDGTLWSMPFNSSTPVLYYDRAAFETAGLDPDSPPTTFAEVRAVAAALVDAGVADVGITFANYCWFVEQWFAEADQPLVDRANGRAGTPTEAYLDGDVARTVFEWIHGMEADGLYRNPGIEARGEARSLFHDGEAAMLIDSTSSLTGVRDGADFPVGVGYFPVPEERHGVVVGGASLWVTDDATPEEQRAAARFLAWLAQPEQQARWHQESGYFPIHQGAVERLESAGWFDDNPGYRTAVEQLLASESTPATNGARIGPFNTVRTLVSEAYEDVARGVDLDDVLAGLDQQVEVRLERYREGLEE